MKRQVIVYLIVGYVTTDRRYGSFFYRDCLHIYSSVVRSSRNKEFDPEPGSVVRSLDGIH